MARLHSGDLSVWSAVAEQVRRLEGLGIPYTLTPGVPAFAAAAAALGRELTIPEVAQSLVLTRVSGRASAMPEGETLAGFGATGATLAIHLAIHALERVVAELVAALRGGLSGGDRGAGELAGGAGGQGDARDDRGPGGGGSDRPDGDHLRRAGAGGGGLSRERALRCRLPAAVPGAGGVSLGAAIGRLAPELPEFPAGEVWLAGAGPGSLGCLTLEVVAALAAADAVVYDALVAPEVLRAARAGAALHFVGKRRGRPSTPQEAINALLVRLAGEGRRVLRLKGGDPNIFGRGGEEALALARAGVGFRVLPGVSSAFGALASARIPATRRGVNKALILATGHGVGTDDDLDWAALARTGQPIVIYMGLAGIGEIAAALMAGGLAPGTPAAVIASATTPEERVLVADLGSIAERVAAEGVRAPALIVVGAIVALREELVALARAEAGA